MGKRRAAIRRTLPTPPALLAGCAVVAFALVPLLSWQAAESAAAGRAVDQARLCVEDSSSPCLGQAPGTLGGPDAIRRSVNSRWSVTGVDGTIEVGPDASSGLRSGERVTALTFRGDFVVVESSDGRWVTDLDVGARGVVGRGAWTLLALMAGAGFLRLALRERRSSGAWWRLGVPATPTVEPPVAVGATAPFCCLLLMSFGAPWGIAVVGGIVAGIGLLVAFAASRRRARNAALPRHARDPA